MTRSLAAAVILTTLLAGCKKDGGIPAYMQMHPITTVTQAGQGTDRHNITETWIYANDQLLGVWEAGARIPVLAEGSTDIKVIAGVRRNGITTDRVQYPFFATYNTDIDLVPEATTPLAPVFSYYGDLTFWNEDFDGNGFQFDREAVSDTVLYVWDTIQHPPSEIFEGRACGAFFLDATRPFFSYVYDGDAFDVDVSDPCWLELHYRSDMRFLIGVYVTDNGSVTRIPYLYVNASKADDGSMPWKKIYVDLQSAWPYPGVTDRKFYIEASLPSDQSTGQVYLDNFKVIHR